MEVTHMEKPLKLNRDLSPEQVKAVMANLQEVHINLARYSENPAEILSYPEWHNRKRCIWDGAKLCKSAAHKLLFKQWIEQGNNSLAEYLRKLNPDVVLVAGKKFPYENGKEVSKQEKLEKYWELEEYGYKWMSELLTAVASGAYDAFFAAEISELIKQGSAKEYLTFIEKIGLDSTAIEDEISYSLTKKRFRNDTSSVKNFRESLNS
jgi:hypothetical protein